MSTTYDAIMVLADGNMVQNEFVTNHVTLEVRAPEKEKEFFDLLGNAARQFD